ncbi:MAG: hypothetical protein DKM50_08435 [Candidatus Margulisiibacteriota bacterium]|nr:MAG: hypothetical protein A2X43_12015 [Candidatus Margulisbacteria bacterium GWD2_39_127]OGI03181.1 MAG: hypothetical protein A2X42_11255 [Candidatus Margulisbacteria bacterium GWF2_38_17]PZM79477.1 MAG: hypothetical protein DKM50_08435 [Candidatus Margulisiibacteriota bacterium]HAR63853.1 hypothetical protein [Candidatus Margulisiibacteriota bacterium]HCT85910.1 hypothetical protein [Candidatus Margulisiibacteriota bacterium]
MNFGEMIKHYRTKEYSRVKAFAPLKSNELAKLLGVTPAFITNVETKGLKFSEDILRKFADLYKMDELEFAQILLQREIEQYSDSRCKKTLKNFIKMIPLYKKCLSGEIKMELEKPDKIDDIHETLKAINRIEDKNIRDFLKADVEYIVRKQNLFK